MSSIYNQPQVSHPSLAHRAAGDTGENGHHLEVCRWVKLVKGVIFGQTRDSLKIRGNHYALSYPFWGGVAWPYLDLGRCIYLYIHVTHKQPKIQLEGCSSVASLSLGCISHANTHNIPHNILLEWWVLLNLSANWWDTLRFLPHIFQTHKKPEFWGISFKGRPRAPHGTSQSATGVPRYPALHCHIPLTSLRFQGNWRDNRDTTLGRPYVMVLKIMYRKII